MAATIDPKDPRYLPYRVGMYGLYFLVAAAFSTLLIISVVKSVWRMSPGPLPPAEPTLTTRECIDAADALWRDLDHERQQLASRSPVHGADPTWYNFRVGWLTRYREAESHCALESHDRGTLKVVYGRLDDLMDRYTTSTVQFDGQVGGAVDGLRAALAEARKDPSAGRF